MNNHPINSNRNMLVIKASAGSGKTYNLALQYIQHLLFATTGDGRLVPRRHGAGVLNAHRQLLAITFTNAATDEMKDRIVKELYLLSQPGMDSDYLEGFMHQSGLAESSVRTLARQALCEMLFDYSNFNVSTIDSFFQSILRNFARELDRDFNYDIQLDEEYAVRVAVHNFLMGLGRQGMPGQVNEWVKTYQQHLIHGDAKRRKWKFFDDGGDLFKFAKKLNSELFRSRMADIRTYLGYVDDNGEYHSDFTRIGKFKQFLHKTVKSYEEKVLQILEDLRHTLEPIRDSLNGTKTFKRWLNKGGVDPLSNTVMGADGDVIMSQFLKGKVPDEAVIDRLLELVTNYFKIVLAMEFFKHIETNLGVLGMLAMIDLFLQEYRHESNSILIGDTNELIGTVLESGSAFVYERVGSTIAHFMIDEFQDTSTKQYENFRGLLKESLASGNFNMLIGDAKQSIYRFRNADPTVFREKVDIDFKDEIYQPIVEKGKPTSTNYRSSRHIVLFNNAFFEAVKETYRDTSVVVSAYSDVQQGLPNKIDEKKAPGYVKLFLGGYHQLVDPSQTDAADGGDEVGVLDILPEYLKGLHERFEWGQIGILVNTNKEGNSIVERILDYNKHLADEQRIEIVSGESLLLNNSPIIRRIIAMLRFIDISQFSPGDDSEDDSEDDRDDKVQTHFNRKRESDQRLYAALGSFIKEISARDECSPIEIGEMLDRCLEGIGGTVGDYDSQQTGENNYSELLGTMLPPANELTTLVSIVETIIASFKRNATRETDIDNEAAFLFAFQDAVMDFSSKRNGGSVREFLKYWDEQKGRLAVKSSSTSNSVNIMTIHGAKGLEFDCVLIPFATWDLTNNSNEHDYWMPSEAFVDALRSLPVEEKEWTVDMVPPLLNVSKKSAMELNKIKSLSGKAATFVNRQFADLLIDNLNKTYVAFTRPCTEMHIMSKPPVKNKRKSSTSSDTEPPKNMSELLSCLAPMVMTPIMNPDGGTPVWYEYGELSTREQLSAFREKSEKDSEQQHELSSSFIKQYTVTEIPKSIGVRVEHASSRYIDAGIRLHNVLSGIHDRDDVEQAISLGLKHGVITNDPDDPCGHDNVVAHVSEPIMAVGSRIAAWFDPANKVYSERTITTASSLLWDDGIENLRPDRIVRRPDGTLLVIDYKSGERRDKQYCRQVQRYIDKLRLIFPDATIAGRIWYITHDVILDENQRVLSIMG